MESTKGHSELRMNLINKNQRESSITPDEYLDLFNKAMKKLAKAVDKEMGEERYLIYFEQLHKYLIEEIQVAVDQAIHDEEYNVIPPVGKLIRYIEEKREEAGRDFLRQESRVLLEQRPQSREEGRAEAGKALVIISRKISKMEEKRESERRTKWEANKKVLDGQARLMALNSEKGE